MSGVTDPTEPYFKDGNWGWDGTQWRKLVLLWGYSESWAEDLGGIFVAGGVYFKASTGVPAGYVYVVQQVSLRNRSGARGMSEIVANAGAGEMVLDWILAPGVYEPVSLSGALVLPQGGTVAVRQYACVANDNMEAGVIGYKMKIAE